MKTIIALVLALIVGGCAAGGWRVVSPKCAAGQTAWANKERCGKLGERRFLFVDHPEERPDRCLYVIDSTSAFYSPNGFVLTLRPARPTDTGRHFAWHELPTVFSPCP